MSKDGSPYLRAVPTDLDAKGNFEGVQLVFAGREIPLRKPRRTWRRRSGRVQDDQPDLIDNFKEWAAELAAHQVTKPAGARPTLAPAANPVAGAAVGDGARAVVDGVHLG